MNINEFVLTAYFKFTSWNYFNDKDFKEEHNFFLNMKLPGILHKC